MPYGGGRSNKDALKLLWDIFETRSRFVLSISRALRRDRDLYLLYLVLRDEIENLLYQILNFKKGTRNKKGYLVVEREFSLLNLKRF